MPSHCRRWLTSLMPCLLFLVLCGAVITLAPSAIAKGDLPAPPAASVYLPTIFGMPPPKILIAAAYIDSSLSYEPDEAILLWNTGLGAQPLAGWSLRAGTKPVSYTHLDVYKRQ